MAPSAGISGLGVAVATTGAYLMYIGIRDVSPLEGLRAITSGRLPKGNRDKDGTAVPGAASSGGGDAGMWESLLGAGSAISRASARLNSPSSATPAVAGAGGGGPLPQLAAAAMKYRGVPYRWGGTNPSTGLDCSALVQRAFADIGIADCPRTTYGQQPWKKLRMVSRGAAGAGDLVFWPGHVAIYLGGGQVVHAPRPGTVVRTAAVDSAGPAGTSPVFKRYVGGGGSSGGGRTGGGSLPDTAQV